MPSYKRRLSQVSCNYFIPTSILYCLDPKSALTAFRLAIGYYPYNAMLYVHIYISNFADLCTCVNIGFLMPRCTLWKCHVSWNCCVSWKCHVLWNCHVSWKCHVSWNVTSCGNATSCLIWK